MNWITVGHAFNKTGSCWSTKLKEAVLTVNVWDHRRHCCGESTKSKVNHDAYCEEKLRCRGRVSKQLFIQSRFFMAVRVCFTCLFLSLQCIFSRARWVYIIDSVWFSLSLTSVKRTSWSVNFLSMCVCVCVTHRTMLAGFSRRNQVRMTRPLFKFTVIIDYYRPGLGSSLTADSLSSWMT